MNELVFACYFYVEVYSAKAPRNMFSFAAATITVVAFSISLSSIITEVRSGVITEIKPGVNNELEQSETSYEITRTNDAQNVKKLLTALLLAKLRNSTQANDKVQQPISKRSKRFSCWHSCLGPWKLKNPGVQNDRLRDNVKLVPGSPDDEEIEVDEAIATVENGVNPTNPDGEYPKSAVKLDLKEGEGGSSPEIGEETSDESDEGNKANQVNQIFVDLKENGNEGKLPDSDSDESVEINEPDDNSSSDDEDGNNDEPKKFLLDLRDKEQLKNKRQPEEVVSIEQTDEVESKEEDEGTDEDDRNAEPSKEEDDMEESREKDENNAGDNEGDDPNESEEAAVDSEESNE